MLQHRVGRLLHSGHLRLARSLHLSLQGLGMACQALFESQRQQVAVMCVFGHPQFAQQGVCPIQRAAQ